MLLSRAMTLIGQCLKKNSLLIGQQVCQGLVWLVVRLDLDCNQRWGMCISPEGRTPSVLVIPTT